MTMMKRLFVMGMAVMLSLGMAAGDGKLSVWLREAAGRQQKDAAGRRGADERGMLTTVFLQLGREVGDDELAEYGARRYAQLEDIAIVTVPLSQVDALAELDAVLRIEANRPAQLTMDTVPRVVRALPAYEATSRHPAFTGAGVVVGIMDVGFDLSHPNFYRDAALGESRIKAFWDQLAPSADRAALPVGREWTSPADRAALPVGREWTSPADIAALGRSTDGATENHGTHTLGIAAGSGYLSPYRGIAFGSELCLVANAVSSDTIYIDRNDYYLYTSATDALGFKYLFDYADRQGKPCVVSFSEGYTPYMDEDDRLYSRFLRLLTGPGRILVSSAGNENQSLTYVGKPRGVERAGAFIDSSRESATYRIQTDGAATITLQTYDGTAASQSPTRNTAASQSLTWNTAGLPADETVADTLFIGTDTCAVALTAYPSAFSDARTICQLTLTANRKLHQLPRQALVVAGTDCEVEVFGSSSSAFANDATDARWNAATGGHNIVAPGCFDAVVTVGSTTHRLSYTNAEGTVSTSPHSDDLRRLSWFSSTGPTMDGRRKPDVTAPGANVLSSMSSYYLEAHPDDVSNYVRYDDCGGRTYPWGAKGGTSMSTPVVAGIIALWLEADPTLTRDDIMGILSRSCRHPESDADYPNNRYGYGEIDAYRGLLDILGLSGIDTLSKHQPNGVDINAAHGQLLLRFDNPPAAPFTVAVYSTAGTLLAKHDVQPANTTYALALPAGLSGIFAIQLTTSDRNLTGSQLVRL